MSAGNGLSRHSTPPLTSAVRFVSQLRRRRSIPPSKRDKILPNPPVPAFRYDPYDKRFTREGYDHDEMRKLRGESVKKARKTLVTAEKVEADENVDSREKELQGNDGAGGWAVVLGTLGRQGSLSVLSVSPRRAVVLPAVFRKLTHSLP